MSSHHHTYITRWWQVDSADEETEWRFVLEMPLAQKKRGFTSIDDLLHAIRQEFENTSNQKTTFGDKEG